MNKHYLLFTFLLLGSIPKFVIAQDKTRTDDKEELSIKFQIRPRTEVRNGVFTPILSNQKPAIFTSQRSRIGFNYVKGDKLTTAINLQSVNVWGNDPQVQTTANSVSLFEAWAKLKLSNSSSLKLGRQVFSYDDERILGELDWNNAARKHDALLYKYEKKNLKTDVAFAFNQNSEKVNNTFFNEDASQPYKSMQFVWAKYKFSETVSVSSLLLNISRQRSIDSLISNLQTLGFNIYYKKNKFSATSTFYYQVGNTKFKNAPTQKTNAALASIYGSYAATKKVSLGFGSDYLSGNAIGSSSLKNQAFNPLYGTHHKFYGLMDIFYVASPHRNTGLWDNYVSANFKPSAKTNFQIAVHHFTAPVTLLNYNGATVNSYLGNEVDLSFNHDIDKSIKLMGGYSQMFTGKSLRYLKNIADASTIKTMQNWLWLSININPEIIIHKK